MPAERRRRRGEVRASRRRPGQRQSFDHGDETPAPIRNLAMKLGAVVIAILVFGIVELIDRMWSPPSPLWARVQPAIQVPGVDFVFLPTISTLSETPGGEPLAKFSAYEIAASGMELAPGAVSEFADIRVPFPDVGLMGRRRTCVFQVTGEERDVDGERWIELRWRSDE